MVCVTMMWENRISSNHLNDSDDEEADTGGRGVVSDISDFRPPDDVDD